MPRLALLLALAPLACAPLGPTLGDPESTGESSTTEIDPTAAVTTGESTSTTDATTTDHPDATDSNDGTCEATFIPIVPAFARVMLVLDKSGSMDASPTHLWDHDGDDADDDGLTDTDPPSPATPKITRWAGFHAALASFLPDFANRAELGAVLFPSAAATNEYGEAACPVSLTPEVPIAPANAAAILAAIPQADATTLDGGSPITAGITTALAALAELSDDAQHAIVLVTDGAANCRTDVDSNSERFETLDPQLAVVVAQALADGVPTFVVGIAVADGVSPDLADGEPDHIDLHAELDELATLGGRPQDGDDKFFNARTQAALLTSLTAIGDQLLPPCTTALADLPVELLRQVRVGHSQFDDPVADCSTDDGWRFTDATRTAIELCGQACDDFREQGGNLVYAPCWPR